MFLKGLRVEPALLLAPMAGLTHTAFRRLVRELGGGGLLATEMLSARSLPREDPRRSPYLRRTLEERPLAYQLLVAEPSEVAPALDVLHAQGADACDLNMGCPAPEARRRGGGSRLMERAEAARAIVAEARRRTELPLTAKIRLGERLEEAPLRDFCQMLEGEGVDLVTVHARLRGEPYGRKPRWEWAGKVKSWLSVPVVANGGVFGAEDARRCLAISKCDGVMVGRGAAVRPWALAEVAATLRGEAAPHPPCLPTVFRRFAELLAESFAPERRLGRLKQFAHYFGQNYAFGHTLASAVQGSRSFEEALERAAGFFEKNEPSPTPDP